MRTKESFIWSINQELGSKIPGNIVFPDFPARVKRTGIVGISGIASNPDDLRNPGTSNIIDFLKKGKVDLEPNGLPKKENVYHPGKITKEVVQNQDNVVRLRRKSRCDGIHDAEEKPCGSPRCRTKGRQKLTVTSTYPDRKRVRKPAILRGDSNLFKKAS